jgi:hypothetical protein
MPLNLASPGIVVREVDLTLGRATPSSDKIGAIVAPFVKGPVDSPTLVENENDLLNNFGEPYTTDKHYEHWMVASSYLAYGGTLLVSRADDASLNNSFVGTASSIKIKSEENYNQLGYDENTITNVTIAARNPGSWANGIRVAIIDAKADQILTGITTTNVVVGYGFTQAISTTSPFLSRTTMNAPPASVQETTTASGLAVRELRPSSHGTVQKPTSLMVPPLVPVESPRATTALAVSIR